MEFRDIIRVADDGEQRIIYLNGEQVATFRIKVLDHFERSWELQMDYGLGERTRRLILAIADFLS